MWLALWLAAPASAIGVGSTGAISLGTFDLFDGFDGFGYGLGFAPSLDLHTQPVLVQIHAIEFLNGVIAGDGEIVLGANVLFSAHEASMGGSWLGVVEPGFGIDIYGDPFVMVITGQCRLGGQIQDAAALGVYVVPELGIAIDDGDANWIGGGTLQLSVWFGG